MQSNITCYCMYSTAVTERECDLEFKATKDIHTLLSQASYGMSIVSILEEIDCVVLVPHCTCKRRMYSRVPL